MKKEEWQMDSSIMVFFYFNKVLHNLGQTAELKCEDPQVLLQPFL